jgi:hypothetical protein
MITRYAKTWSLLSVLALFCLMGQTCGPAGPGGGPGGGRPNPPETPVDPDEELIEALGGEVSDVDDQEEAEAEQDLVALNAAGDELETLIEDMPSEEAAKAEMVNRLNSTVGVESAATSYFGIVITYDDGTEAAIVTDFDDGDPEGMVEGEQDPTGGVFEIAKGSRTMKSADLVASKKTIFLNPHYWERKPLADNLIATANARFKECDYDNFVVYKNEGCRIAKFMRLSDYGIVHIYSHGLAWPTKHNAQRVYLMTGHVATARSLAWMKSKNLVPHKIAYIWTKYLNNSTRKPMYVISPEFIAEHNDFSESKALVYLGFCHSYRGGFQNTIVDSANAQAALSVNWSVSTVKNVQWAKSMYNALGDTSRDEPIDLREWYTTTPHHYAYTDTDASGNPMNVTVRLRAKGNGDTILWEKPEEMDPCLERAIRQQLGLPDDAELTSADLMQVTFLEAKNVGIQTLAGIGGCANLETLDLSSNEIVDLSPLSELKNIRNLYLVDNKIQDVSPLASLTSLESLLLTHNFIGSISSLSNLTNLDMLKVGWQQNKAITSLNGVENMTKLTWLGASGNSISGLGPVSGCTSLKTLNATHNQITSYSGVTNLTALQTLHLDENNLTSLAGLMGAAFLQNDPSIYVTCCPIETNCDPTAGPTIECQRKEQLEQAGAFMVWGYRGYCGTEPPLLGIPDEHEVCTAQ